MCSTTSDFYHTADHNRGGADLYCDNHGYFICESLCLSNSQCKGYNYITPDSPIPNWDLGGCCYKNDNAPLSYQFTSHFYARG
jgi:hypothetical protein